MGRSPFICLCIFDVVFVFVFHDIPRWRKEFQENLARKDAEEKEKMEELKSKAKKELEDW